jgi:hypothetical protein
MPVILGLLVGIGIVLRRSIYRTLKRSWQEMSQQSAAKPPDGEVSKPSDRS